MSKPVKSPGSAVPIFPKGWRIFPLPPGSKEADLKNWPNIATDDVAQIEAWQAQIPNANWAVAMGPSGLAVIDIDGEIGEASLFDFQLEEGFLPDTREHSTARGGRHLIYSDPNHALRNSVGKLGPKLDTRGSQNGREGYVVIPPSTFDGKPYTVAHDRPIAPLPQFVADAAGASRERVTAPDGVKLDDPVNIGRAKKLIGDYINSGHVAIEGQGGDALTFAVAAEIMGLGLSPDAALEVLDDWNKACHPPWDIEELRVKIANAGQYGQNDAGCFAVAPITDRIPAEALDRLKAESAASAAPAPQSSKASSGSPFRIILERDFASLPTPEYLVEKLMPKPGLIVVYGKPGTKKTFVVTQIAASIALGFPVFGKFAVKQGPAICWLGEQAGDFAVNRFPAFKVGHGTKGAISNFGIAQEVPMFSDPEQLDDAIAQIKATGLRPAVIVVDTLAKAMRGLKENDNSDMELLVTGCKRLMNEFDCTVILIHHVPKASNNQDTPRGAYALSGAADAEFKVTSPGPLLVRLHCTKMRLSEPPADILLKAEKVLNGLFFTMAGAVEFAKAAKGDLSQATICRVLKAAQAVRGVTVTKSVIALELIGPPSAAVAAGNEAAIEERDKAIAALEKKLQRAAKDYLSAFVVAGTGTSPQNPYQWTLPIELEPLAEDPAEDELDDENEGDE